MSRARLSDLDELTLSVRDKISQTYIKEAVDAYYAGVFRAAVISTWIAVVYDISSKIRELAEQNDAEAKQYVEELEKFIKNEEILQLQKIEASILSTALQKFQFISSHEFNELKRLQEDRHKCAHPAYVTDELLFQPTPEAVRTHIVHSITHLLQPHPYKVKLQ